MPSKSLMGSNPMNVPIWGLFVGILLSIALFDGVKANPTAQVTYVSPVHVYLSAGKVDGIQVGDEIKVERNHEVVAFVRIEQVSDTGARAIVVNQKRTLRVGDILRISNSPFQSNSVKAKRASKPVHASINWDETRLSSTWTQSMEDTPPMRVVYRKRDGSTAPSTSLTMLAGTEVKQYSYFQSARYLQTEQSLWFSAGADNQWISGLSWTLDGAALARYDDRTDLYLQEQRFVPYIRNLSIQYRFQRHPIVASLGRFVPDAPMVHTIDGINFEVQNRRFELLVFSGFQPDEMDLAFNGQRQTLGTALRIHFGPSNAYHLETGVMTKIFKGQIYRAAVAVNSRFSRDSGALITQTAVVDLMSAENEVDSGGGFSLTNAAVNAVWPLSKTTDVDISARYSGQTVFTEDYAAISRQWISSLADSGFGRVETGLSTQTKRNNFVRPFGFGRGEIRSNRPDGAVGGVGIQLDDRSFFSTRTGMTTVIDYGIGSGQMANIDVTFNTPLKEDNLQLLSGLFTTWQWVYHSDVHTLRNFAFLMLRGRIRDHFDVTANWNTGYDHALVRRIYPLGVWMQFQLGVVAYY